MKLKLFITLLLLAVMPAFAQNTGVSGVVVDADSGQPIAGATVLLQQGSSAFTGPNGDFRISAAHTGDETLTVIAYGYKDIVTSVAIDSHSVTNLGTLKMAVDKSIATSTDMAVLDENQIEDEEGNDQSIGMLAGASDDVYYNAASYDFSVMRFRLRGYAQEYSQMYVNGVHLTDAIRGRFNYSSFGGMNQAFKSKAASIGLTRQTTPSARSAALPTSTLWHPTMPPASEAAFRIPTAPTQCAAWSPTPPVLKKTDGRLRSQP